MRVPKRRRREGKTDYKARIGMLKSDFGRIVFRKSNRYVIGQFIESKEAQDKVIVGVISKELIKYGWPKKDSIKNLGASYLTGFLLGKKMIEKGKKEAILDIGLLRSTPKSKIYAFCKGIIDAGVKLKVKEEMLPSYEIIKEKSNVKNFEEIKNKIEK